MGEPPGRAHYLAGAAGGSLSAAAGKSGCGAALQRAQIPGAGGREQGGNQRAAVVVPGSPRNHRRRLSASFARRGRLTQELASDERQTAGAPSAPRRSRSHRHRNGVNLKMLDILYVAAGCGFLLLCWAFTKACDKL